MTLKKEPKARSVNIITKRFLIDFLNTTFFEKTLCWNGSDLFNDLPTTFTDEDDFAKVDQRACLLVHNRLPTALRFYITSVEEKYKQIVTYHTCTIKDKILLEDEKRTVFENSNIKFEFSLSDLNFGATDSYFYSFYDTFGDSISRTLSFLNFILNSSIYAHNDVSVFEDKKKDVLSFYPCPGDDHYSLVH